MMVFYYSIYVIVFTPQVMALESIFADTDRLRVIGAPNNIVPVDGLGGEPEKKVTSSDVVKPKKKNFILQVRTQLTNLDHNVERMKVFNLLECLTKNCG